MNPVTDMIVAYLRGQAEWRDHVAEEFPEDTRNVRSATQIREVADYIEQEHDDEDDLVSPIVRLHTDLGAYELLAGEETLRVASRIGFDQDDSEMLALVVGWQLLPAIERDAKEYRSEHRPELVHVYQVEIESRLLLEIEASSRAEVNEIIDKEIREIAGTVSGVTVSDEQLEVREIVFQEAGA